jgi:hypothetical protein
MSRYFIIAIATGLTLLVAMLLALFFTPKSPPTTNLQAQVSQSDMRGARQSSF